MDLANSIYNYDRLKNESSAGAEKAAVIKAEIIVEITKDSMASLYTHLCDKYAWEQDTALLTKMQEANTAAVAVIDEKRESADINAGDTEVCLLNLFLLQWLSRASSAARHHYPRSFQ